MFAVEGRCSRGKPWREQYASVLNLVSIIGRRQGPVLPIGFGMKRKIFSGAGLFVVPSMPTDSNGAVPPM